MRFIYFIFLLMFNSFSIGQQIGIKFENKLSWIVIKQKAKEENKYIFLDAYTTWCIPCRNMAITIFPQKKVGDFFNKNFINVAVQMDSTKEDNEYVKSWYKDAKMIAGHYKIDAYPTYLFFNPDGVLVHFIKGSKDNANDFITNAKNTFDPKTQILNLKNEYDNGKRDSGFLLTLINAAKIANDDSLPVFIKTYLVTQNNLLTQQNINFIARGTKHSNDIGFDVLLNYPMEVDAVIGKSKRIKILSKIAFDEQIYPLLRKNGKITHIGTMTIYREDSLTKNVNWDSIKSELSLKYKGITEQIVLNAKLIYYEWLNDWSNFNTSLSNYTSNNDEIILDFIDNYAWEFTTFCNDKKYLKEAIMWASRLVKNENHPYYLQTYSRLLYKAGEKDLAIKYLEECVLLLKSPNKSINGILEKMRNNETIE